MAIQSLTDLKALINSTIQDNTTNDISGSDVQTALINAIDTLDSLEGFINVHKANGQTTITAYGSKALARAAVPDDCKKEGVVIAYKISTGWLIEQNLDATAGTWGDDASWQTIGPVSVSQNIETDGLTKDTINVGSHSIADVADFKSLMKLQEIQVFDTRAKFSESAPTIVSGNASDYIYYVPVRKGDVVLITATGNYNSNFSYGFSTVVPAINVTVSNAITLAQDLINLYLSFNIDGYLVISHVNYRFADQQAFLNRWKDLENRVDITSELDSSRGDYNLKKDSKDFASLPSSHKLIKLSGIGAQASAYMPNIGDIGFDTSEKKLYKRTGSNYGQWVEVPFYDGAIYQYENELYTWNGTDLVKSELAIERQTPNFNLLHSYRNPVISDFIVIFGGFLSWKTGAKSILLPIKEGDIVAINTSSGSMRYGFLSDYPPSKNNTGNVVISSVVVATAEHTGVAPQNAKYLIVNLVDTDDTSIPTKIGKLVVNGYDYKTSVQEKLINLESLTFDIAEGSLLSFGSNKSEQAASPIRELSKGYVGFKTINNPTKRHIRKNIVAINHDDLQPSDYIDNRKIYNKFRFNANFNFILRPLTSDNINETILNIRKMVNDGNTIGLHAIFDKSYWIVNKCFDVRPVYGFTFAPSKYEVQTIVADGKNVFGKTITATTKISEAGYSNLPSGITDYLVTEMTDDNFKEITRCFTLYGNQYDKYTGLDLNGNTVEKTALQWLEYWYNTLIDSSLGYSSESLDIDAKYGADYECPDNNAPAYYPNTAQMLSGKVVFYDDTANPHYLEALVSTDPNFNTDSYQLVGRFKKGLFKGSATCCNFEVIDRCLMVAKAFIRHYFGIDNFATGNRHGIGYCSNWWTEDGIRYDDSQKKILTSIYGTVVRTRDMVKVTLGDILLSEGIKMINHSTNSDIDGTISLYKGQKGIRSDYFNNIVNPTGRVTYLNFFGSSEVGGNLTLANFNTFVAGIEDYLKFAYENAGQSVTRNGLTYTVFGHLKGAIDVIRGCMGTGKIPVLSFDTIRFDASISTALDLLLRFCYANDIEVVSPEYARELCVDTEREFENNYMPNPQFEQSLIRLIGDSSKPQAYIPDGWIDPSSGTITSVVVSSATIDGKVRRTLEVTGESASITSLIYGLKPGNYRMSCYVKSGSLSVQLRTNSMPRTDTSTNKQIVYGGVDYAQRTIDFTVPEPHRNPIDYSDAVSQICRGYEDNVNSVKVSIWGDTDVAIAEPRIEKL